LISNLEEIKDGYFMRRGFITAVATSGFAIAQAAATTQSMTRDMNSGSAISDAELSTLESNALSGDGKAAGRVGTYFGVSKGDVQQQMYWLQISAEDGDNEGEVEFALLLNLNEPRKSMDAIKHDKMRACYWLNKAVAEGYKLDSVYTQFKRGCETR
jgi:TPR repeat protein